MTLKVRFLDSHAQSSSVSDGSIADRWEAVLLAGMRIADHSFHATVSTLALNVLPEIGQVVYEMNRVTRPGGIVASAVHQFLGGMTAFDLVINTAAVFDAFARAVGNSGRMGRRRYGGG